MDTARRGETRPTDMMIFETIHGSHLYNLAHKDSDMDLYKVYEGEGLNLRQSVHAGVDVVRGDLEAFVRRAQSGSHQSCEALFSPVKEFAPGMEEKRGPYLEGFRVTGREVFEKYERTIKKFCYGDYKRRRHAARLHLSLRGLRSEGRFNPRLDGDEARWCTLMADAYSGDDLRGVLLG